MKILPSADDEIDFEKVYKITQLDKKMFHISISF